MNNREDPDPVRKGTGSSVMYIQNTSIVKTGTLYCDFDLPHLFYRNIEVSYCIIQHTKHTTSITTINGMFWRWITDVLGAGDFELVDISLALQPWCLQSVDALIRLVCATKRSMNTQIVRSRSQCRLYDAQSGIWRYLGMQVRVYVKETAWMKNQGSNSGREFVNIIAQCEVYLSKCTTSATHLFLSPSILETLRSLQCRKCSKTSENHNDWLSDMSQFGFRTGIQLWWDTSTARGFQPCLMHEIDNTEFQLIHAGIHFIHPPHDGFTHSCKFSILPRNKSRAQQWWWWWWWTMWWVWMKTKEIVRCGKHTIWSTMSCTKSVSSCDSTFPCVLDCFEAIVAVKEWSGSNLPGTLIKKLNSECLVRVGCLPQSEIFDERWDEDRFLCELQGTGNRWSLKAVKSCFWTGNVCANVDAILQVYIHSTGVPRSTILYLHMTNHYSYMNIYCKSCDAMKFA